MSPIVAAYVWQDHMLNSYSVYYEDNDGARFNLMGGFTSDYAASLLLAVFWGAAAVHKSRPWINRVASADNPADCLTKAGLPRGHLRGAVWEDADLQPLWQMLQSSLHSEEFPAWSAFASVFAASVQ